MPVYYFAILAVSLANLLLAGIAYAQRKKQIRGNAIRERQLALAQTRNALAADRLDCLNDQLSVLGEIRDRLSAADRRLFEPPPLVGVIDVGSGTVRLVVGRYDPDARRFGRLCNTGAHLGLGAEVERFGGYGSSKLEEVAEHVRLFARQAHDAGCARLVAVVTAPGRSGTNPDELVRVVRCSAGREPYALRPKDEAELAFVGATMGSPEALEHAVVCDVGGGSTEVASGSPADGISHTASFDVGAFVLAQRHFRHDPPDRDEIAAARRDVESMLNVRPVAAARLALAAGGSARAVARLAGPVLGPEELTAALAAARSSKNAPKAKYRRRALPAGIVILEVLQSRLRLPLTVATGGLREGVLLHLSGLAAVSTAFR